ncbi:NADH-quinone oxidoreductase subunit NuoF [Vibrio sp. CAU 1672]|uniref:NADH-quinone oxidoreductase subunit NuoF n=1 Tax=Vibrio sp. CAU 1672 TaxID=3032594 RepID=UPI0023DAFBE8|nr:NADH-quinone oxidoreductase subunit NuoF [Vibrio sp. CAU 1672]MDF2153494.1 NADH-quinone oxidoreductase subunit NuoF [Vibrio sp. CAU 1672]
MNLPVKRISSFEALRRLPQQLGRAEGISQILVCAGGGCLASGSDKVVAALREQIATQQLNDRANVIAVGCMGLCVEGPVMLMLDDMTFYQQVKPEDAAEIVNQHLLGGQVIERLVARDSRGSKANPSISDIDFFSRQTKIVLRHCGHINPESITEALNVGVYQALGKVLDSMTADDVIEQMKISGLRGRGGAGFPTWMKWDATRNSPADQRYMLCNADEGDPGAYMDRSVLEGDPHSLIEGVIIGAYAIGASQGYVYVRAEYPLAVYRLQKALDEARQYGLLGDNILGSGFSFNLEIRMGSGAFVCGEETALMASIEGHRGEPRPRPPFPAQKGLWDKPSCLNNVETFASVPEIINRGADWYAAFGTDKSKGTKVFALAGAVRNTGLVEVPIGTSLGELIYDIGGGIVNNKSFKAAQLGGPSGGCVPKQHLNVPLDYESLSELGAIMGSGGLIVMDDDACMVDVARFFLEFIQEESCGKCVPCRVGTKRMLEILTRICEGRGRMEDIDQLLELGELIRETSLCGLGQTAPNPVLSTIRHFREEYVEHIRDRHCRAGVCPSLVRAPCQTACPAGVDVPGFVSLVAEQRYDEALQLHRSRNPFASVCARVCFHTCEEKCRRASLDQPVSIRGIKRFMVDQEQEPQLPEIRHNDENARRNIAIVGGGPAGISCAFFLARLGYKPVIYEKEPRPGGMLEQAIPAYRLPRETLAREIRMIENMGVTIKTGLALGRDFTIKQLKDEGAEAVFIGIGAPQGVTVELAGSEAEFVVDGIAFLREYNIRGSVPVGRNVAVIGGGNAAIDAARTAIRLGAETVTVLYRRTREEMPAYTEEIDEAIQEGVRIKTLTAPQEIKSDSAGRVAAVKCRHMHLGEFDRSGRRHPEADENECFSVDADQVILAVGQTLDTSVFGTEPLLSSNGWVKADPVTGQTAMEGVFAGGDSVTGPMSVVRAIADGERAAVGIDCFLSGKKHAFWRAEHENTTDYDPDADPVPYPREAIQMIPVEKRKNNFDEVELAWNEAEAIRQAKRCLRCDYGKCPIHGEEDSDA